MKVGLTEKEFDKIAGQVKRRTPLNDAIMGKLKKVATPDQLTKLVSIENQFGEALPFCPAISILRNIKLKS